MEARDEVWFAQSWWRLLDSSIFTAFALCRLLIPVSEESDKKATGMPGEF